MFHTRHLWAHYKTYIGTCTERNRTARVSIGRHRTHHKNTNLQIAAGSGSIGWHGVVLIRGPMVVECHIVAWFDPPNVISVNHVSLAHTAVFNWWFVSSVAIDPQIINSNSQRLCIVPHSCYNAKPSRRYHRLRVNHYASVKFDQVHRRRICSN